MFGYFKNLFGKEKEISANIFSFTPYKILSEKDDQYIQVTDLSHSTVINELENSNNYELSKYYKNVKEYYDNEFSETKFEAICFHNNVNVITTLSTKPKDLLNLNSVICIRFGQDNNNLF